LIEYIGTSPINTRILKRFMPIKRIKKLSFEGDIAYTMVRYLFIVAFLLVGTQSLKAQEPIKEWDKNSPLQWSDFKGVVDVNNGGSASVNTGNSYRFKFTMKGGKRVFDFEVSTRMYTSRSWSKPDKQTPELLAFNQNYFDITKYFGGLLKKELEAGTYTGNFQAEIKQVYDANNIKLRAMKGRYFVATAYADDVSLVRQWTAYLADLLSHSYTLEQARKLEPVALLQNTDLRKLWVAQEPLKWDDFKGNINDTSKFAALTYSGVVFTAKVIDDILPKIDFKVAGYYKYYDSWTRPARQTEELLRHEKMHFNISELMSRVMLKTLTSYTYSVNFQDDVSKNASQVHALAKTMQNAYDDQTDHAKNKPMQAKWELYIAQLLAKDFTVAEAFANTPGGAVAYN